MNLSLRQQKIEVMLFANGIQTSIHKLFKLEYITKINCPVCGKTFIFTPKLKNYNCSSDCDNLYYAIKDLDSSPQQVVEYAYFIIQKLKIKLLNND